MIISRAPLRISLAGGGSDLPAFYSQEMGHVLNFTINKYVYVVVHKTFFPSIRLIYSKIEHVENFNEIAQPILKNTLQYFNPKKNIEIGSFADVPSTGSGLGSSSAFTVALVAGINKFTGNEINKSKLASSACHIEINLCGDQIGKQDQYASAFGGINEYMFHSNNSVDVKPFLLDDRVVKRIENNLLLFNLNMSRSSIEILNRQSFLLRNDPLKTILTRKIKEQVGEMKKLLSAEDFFEVGKLLDYNWQLKRQMTEYTTNPEIDEIYESALRLGATGGKVLGAGGGGFLLLCVDEKIQEKFLSTFPLQWIPYEIDFVGSHVTEI
jgi:D-glycero-alpha-D-manno-heptose-7-phosphate kinase